MEPWAVASSRLVVEAPTTGDIVEVNNITDMKIATSLDNLPAVAPLN